jgi:hypothetical protein
MTPPDARWLAEQLEERSMRDIAMEVGVTDVTVGRWVRAYGIDNSRQHGRPRVAPGAWEDVVAQAREEAPSIEALATRAVAVRDAVADGQPADVVRQHLVDVAAMSVVLVSQVGAGAHETLTGAS